MLPLWTLWSVIVNQRYSCSQAKFKSIIALYTEQYTQLRTQLVMVM